MFYPTNECYGWLQTERRGEAGWIDFLVEPGHESCVWSGPTKKAKEL